MSKTYPFGENTRVPVALPGQPVRPINRPEPRKTTRFYAITPAGPVGNPPSAAEYEVFTQLLRGNAWDVLNRADVAEERHTCGAGSESQCQACLNSEYDDEDELEPCPYAEWNDTDWQESYDEMLDDAYGVVTVAGFEYDTSRALRELDPIAYQCGWLDYRDSTEQDCVCGNH